MKTSITTIPFIFIVSLLSIFSGYSFSYIQDVSPLVNSQNLDTKGNITVRFLYEMNAATLNDETVILNGSQSGRIHTLVSVWHLRLERQIQILENIVSSVIPERYRRMNI